jgi:hypothetical protein
MTDTRLAGKRYTLQARVDELDNQFDSALHSVDVLEARLRTIRNDALDEAAKKVRKIMLSYAGGQGGTKTPNGRSANFYGRKCEKAIRDMKTKGTQ